MPLDRAFLSSSVSRRRAIRTLQRHDVNRAVMGHVLWAAQTGLILLFLLAAPLRYVDAQTATFSGTVLVDQTEKPLANAEIVLTDLNRSVRSDSAGNFAFTGLPNGKHAVIVRLIGYESINDEIVVSAAKALEVELLLKPSVTKLKTVDVKASTNGPWSIKLAEFEDRRATAAGRFLTADVFEKADGRPVSAILMENVPGVKAVQQNGRSWLASLRGGKMYACGTGKSCPPGTDKVPPACYMQVVVNGMVRYNGSEGQPMFDIDELNAKDIVGLEFYTTATTPLQYNSTHGKDMGACGTVIIWTK